MREPRESVTLSADRWGPGCEVIERQLLDGELESCDRGSRDASVLLDHAKLQLEGASVGDQGTPVVQQQVAFRVVAYCGAALLAAQGLRPTASGGILALQTALREQFSRGGVTRDLWNLRALAGPPASTGAGPMMAEAVSSVAIARSVVTFTEGLLQARTLHRFTVDDRPTRVGETARGLANHLPGRV